MFYYLPLFDRVKLVKINSDITSDSDISCEMIVWFVLVRPILDHCDLR